MKTYTCTVCQDPIAYVENPGLPQGAIFARWEGWFHLDATKEHFTPVGFRDLQYAK